MQLTSEAEPQTDKSCVGVSNWLEQGSLRGQHQKEAVMRRQAVAEEVAAWELERNSLEAKVGCQLTSDDARINLKRLYPTLDD